MRYRSCMTAYGPKWKVAMAHMGEAAKEVATFDWFRFVKPYPIWHDANMLTLLGQVQTQKEFTDLMNAVPQMARLGVWQIIRLIQDPCAVVIGFYHAYWAPGVSELMFGTTKNGITEKNVRNAQINKASLLPVQARTMAIVETYKAQFEKNGN